jgi:hypothetical protein
MNLRNGVLATVLAAAAALAVAVPAAASPSTTHRHRLDRGRVVMSPRVQRLSAGTGGFTATLTGSHLLPNTGYTLSSPSLAALCGGGLGGVVNTDQNGHFSTGILGAGCVPGLALVEASETTTPFRTFFARFRLVS